MKVRKILDTTFYRNIFSVVPSKHMRTVSDMLKAIHTCEDRDAAQIKAQAVFEKLRAMRLNEAADKIQEGIEETLTETVRNFVL